MDFYKAVYKIAREKEITIESIGLKMGHASTYISRAKYRGSLPGVGTASDILGVCGYKLCAIPEDNVPDDAVVISGKDDE